MTGSVVKNTVLKDVDKMIEACESRNIDFQMSQFWGDEISLLIRGKTGYTSYNFMIAKVNGEKLVFSIQELTSIEGFIIGKKYCIKTYEKHGIPFGLLIQSDEPIRISGKKIEDVSTEDVIAFIFDNKLPGCKYRYEILVGTSMKEVLFGNTNKVVYDYIKHFGGMNIKTSKVESKSGVYTSKFEADKKDGKHINLIVKRYTI